jgi:endonuclease YncB( thermonuclease family)
VKKIIIIALVVISAIVIGFFMQSFDTQEYSKENSYGFAAHMFYSKEFLPIMCPTQNDCSTHLQLNIWSEVPAILQGYKICNGLSCVSQDNIHFSSKDSAIIPIFDGNKWNMGDKISIKVQVATAYDETMAHPFPMPFYIDLGESEITEYGWIAKGEIPCIGTALCYTDTVRKIVDGDTLDIGKNRIRLSLTNTPEKGQEGFSEASDFTRFLCPVGSKAQVDQDDLQPYDKYDRMVGKVTCSDGVLNSELLENHYAEILTQYCSKSEFASEPWATKFGC